MFWFSDDDEGAVEVEGEDSEVAPPDDDDNLDGDWQTMFRTSSLKQAAGIYILLYLNFVNYFLWEMPLYLTWKVNPFLRS